MELVLTQGRLQTGLPLSIGLTGGHSLQTDGPGQRARRARSGYSIGESSRIPGARPLREYRGCWDQQSTPLPYPPVSKEGDFQEDIVSAPANFRKYVIQRAQSAEISDREVCVMSTGGIIKPSVGIGTSSLHSDFNPSQGQHSQNGHEYLLD